MECRLCLDSQPSVELFGRPDPLVTNIWNCCQIEVQKGDGLPEKICSACDKKLSSFVQFRISCANANRTLNERLHNSFNRIKTEHEFDLRIVKNEVITPTDISNVDKKTFPNEKSFASNEKETVSDHVKITDENISHELNDNEEYIADKNSFKVEIDFKYSSCDEKQSESDAVDFDSSSNDETFKCVCDETFSSSKCLKTHFGKSHLKLIDCDNYSEILKLENKIGNKYNVNKKWLMSRVCFKCKKTYAGTHRLRKHLVSTHIDSILNDLKQLINANGNILKNVPKSIFRRRKAKSYIKCNMCDKELIKSRYEKHVLQKHFNVMHGLDSNEQKNEQINDEIVKIILSKASQDQKRKKNTPRECNICGKMVINLSEHVKTHKRKEGGFVCDVCHKSYINPNALNNHKKFLHNAANRVPCNTCGKIYNRYGLKSHMLTHAADTPLECDYCGKKFKRKTTLKGHIASHMGLRPYKCKICSKGFTLLDTLKSHMLQHTGENPFKCELCPRVFKQKPNLKSHMRHFHKESKIEISPNC